MANDNFFVSVLQLVQTRSNIFVEGVKIVTRALYYSLLPLGIVKLVLLFVVSKVVLFHDVQFIICFPCVLAVSLIICNFLC